MRETAAIPQVNIVRNGGVDQVASGRIISVIVSVVFGVTVLAATVNLGGYPATWFDEGSYLQVARNVAHGDVNAQVSADGTRDYAPSIGVGPTLLFPAAAALRLSNDSLAAARLVTALYLLAATGLLYIVARYLFGRAAALMTIALLLALPALDWVSTGRQVLGEVPALVFLLAGGIILTRNTCYKGAVVAGGLFGLTLVTKGQYMLVLPAALCCLALIDRIDQRQRSFRWFAAVLFTAMSVWAMWMVLLVLLMGSGHIAENVRLLRDSSSGALLIVNADRMLAGLKLLVGPSSLGLVLPSLVAGLVAVVRADGKRRFGLQALLVFQVLWFAWFVFASIAWPRYAFPALALNMVFAGWLILSAFRSLPDILVRLRITSPHVVRFVHAATIALVTLAIVGSAVVQLRPITQDRNHDARQFAASLERIVPPGAVVDGWEPEIGFLSNVAIQYPPLGSLDTAVRARWLGTAAMEDLRVEPKGEFLMVGPFGRWVGIYDQEIASGAYERVEQVGAYELWEHTGK